MNKESILQQLEEFAGRLSIKVTYDSLKEGTINTRGGLCKVGKDYRILVEKRLSIKEKIEIIANCIARFDISQHYIQPEVRDIILSYSYKPEGKLPDESVLEELRNFSAQTVIPK